MRLSAALLYILTLCCCAGCNSASDEAQTSNFDTHSMLDDSALFVAPSPENHQDSTIASRCARGFPTPIIDKVQHPEASFKMRKDSAMAWETVVFRNEDRLIIKHWGCKYFMLTYRFETDRFQGDVKDTKYWYGKAALLLQEASEAMSLQAGSTNLIVNSINALNRYTSNTNKPLLREEIEFGHGAVRNYVVLDRVQRLKKKRFSVEVTMAIGPL